MKEIDEILTELHRLLTAMKSFGGTDELHAQIRRLFERANLLLEEIGDIDEMERVYNNAAGVASLASYLFMEKDSEVMEFFRLLGIQGEMKD